MPTAWLNVACKPHLQPFATANVKSVCTPRHGGWSNGFAKAAQWLLHWALRSLKPCTDTTGPVGLTDQFSASWAEGSRFEPRACHSFTPPAPALESFMEAITRTLSCTSALCAVVVEYFYFAQCITRPCGLMDKALVFGTKDCRFESCQGH